MITLTYLEFYSGIGGWGYALEHACRSIAATPVPAAPQHQHHAKRPKISIDGIHDNHDGDCGLGDIQLEAQLLAAYDHSDLANSVFYHNHININMNLCNDMNLSDATATTNAILDNDSDSKIKSKSKKKQQNQINKRYKPRQTPIERITLAELETHSASVWCMSPPCQPHTRQHDNQHKEKDDPRSRSFLHLCELLGEMEEDALPGLILLENVVGFEQNWKSSDNDNDNAEDVKVDDGSHETQPNSATTNDINNSNSSSMGSFPTWRKVLSQRKYHVSHFHLDPTHVGLPNNRPRHYTVAVRPGTLKQRLKLDEEEDGQSSIPNDSTTAAHLFHKESLDKPPIINNEQSLQINGKALPPLPCISSILDATTDPSSSKRESLKIPEKIRNSSSAWCFDIATPHHHRTSCFTHSYGKFIRGTGSILYTGPLSLGEGVNSNDGNKEEEEERCNAVIQLLDNQEKKKKNNNKDGMIGDAATAVPAERFQLELPEERKFDASWSDDLDWEEHVRYFSGTEIARLMGFPVAEASAMVCDEMTCPKMRMALLDGASAVNENGQLSSSSSTFRKFGFPAEITVKQRWKLLGNSLNVRVAACVAEMGIRSILTNEFGGGGGGNDAEGEKAKVKENHV